MALTIIPKYKWAWGASEFFAIIEADGDASYTTGGYAMTPGLFTFNTFAATSDFQLQVPPVFGPVGVWADGQAGTYAFVFSATGNMGLAVSSTGVEVGNGVNVTAVKTLLCAFGH
jgi:hypothetical protein